MFQMRVFRVSTGEGFLCFSSAVVVLQLGSFCVSAGAVFVFQLGGFCVSVGAVFSASDGAVFVFQLGDCVTGS